jgi:trimeric autotransporter adhesin
LVKAIDTIYKINTLCQSSSITGSALTEKYNLSQNAPNPFNYSSTINYHLPQNVKAASIYIVDCFGHLVKKMDLDKQGEAITIYQSELKAGFYFYYLNIDGEISERKKMIVTSSQ